MVFFFRKGVPWNALTEIVIDFGNCYVPYREGAAFSLIYPMHCRQCPVPAGTRFMGKGQLRIEVDQLLSLGDDAVMKPDSDSTREVISRNMQCVIEPISSVLCI